MSKNHKPKIGLIGGVGPQASAYLYQEMIRSAQDNHGARQNHQYPDMVIHSLPIPDFISDTSQLPSAKNMLHQAVTDLEGLWRDVFGFGQ